MNDFLGGETSWPARGFGFPRGGQFPLNRDIPMCILPANLTARAAPLIFRDNACRKFGAKPFAELSEFRFSNGFAMLSVTSAKPTSDSKSHPNHLLPPRPVSKAMGAPAHVPFLPVRSLFTPCASSLSRPLWPPRCPPTRKTPSARRDGGFIPCPPAPRQPVPRPRLAGGHLQKLGRRGCALLHDPQDHGRHRPLRQRDGRCHRCPCLGKRLGDHHPPTLLCHRRQFLQGVVRWPGRRGRPLHRRRPALPAHHRREL